ncbi:MAG: PCRF domain-containing protein, partial [Actinomycetota bacterium]|nr:PCRF domain-containing protein [Actinomycetota bacterium]
MDTAAVQALLDQHADLERRLADPALHADQEAARKAGRRYGELSRIVRVIRELEQARSDVAAGRELAVEDPTFAAEADALAERVPQLEAELAELLLPRDPHDSSDVVMEIKSGEGGAESALFAGDLLRMYLRYAERHGWQAEVLDATEAELGGYKDVTVAVKAATSAQSGVWERLKFEGGVHRVQRVPITESAGRIHTSAAGVLVYP